MSDTNTQEKKSTSAWAAEQFGITGKDHPNYYLIRRANRKANKLGLGEMKGSKIGRLLTAEEWEQIMEVL